MHCKGVFGKGEGGGLRRKTEHKSMCSMSKSDLVFSQLVSLGSGTVLVPVHRLL